MSSGPATRQAKAQLISVKRLAWLVGATFALGLLSWPTLSQWYAVSRASEDASHLVLMPVVAVFLLWWSKQRIFCSASTDRRFILPLIIAAAALLGARWVPMVGWPENDQASLRTALFVVTWVSVFGLLYGASTIRRALFPLAMLLLMVPIPSWLLQQIIYFLQRGSAEGTALLFPITGMPVYRQDLVFLLPGVAIEVAEECSGIRSSMALLITGLLAAHLYLESNVSKAVLILAVVPLAIVKNVIRIVALTYLSVKVDPGFLHGDLHNRGGFVFFFITLLMLGALLYVLRRGERRSSLRRIPPRSGPALQPTQP